MKVDAAQLPSCQTVHLASPLPGHPTLALYLEDGCIKAIDYLWSPPSPEMVDNASAAGALLQRYFSGKPVQSGKWLRPAGTAFQRRVWERLQQIPPSEVMTYGQLAQELASSPRAVAGACRANPVPILIPCHRVVAASGLGGYMGQTAGRELAIKRWLLQHEGYV